MRRAEAGSNKNVGGQNVARFLSTCRSFMAKGPKETNSELILSVHIDETLYSLKLVH